MAAPVTFAAASAATRRASGAKPGLAFISEHDRHDFKTLEGHQRYHRHGLGVSFGGVRRGVANTTDDEAAGNAGGAQRGAVGGQD